VRTILLVVLLVAWGVLASIARPYLSSVSPPDMVRIETGVYTPLFTDGKDGERMLVDAFYLDVYPTTQAQYLAFVEANPQWRRAQVARLFADQGYLQSWQDDQGAARPPAALVQHPVTQVSWFAARVYCQWQGKRLPRLAEWEYAALASDTAPDGRHNPVYLTRLLEWYTRPTPPVPPSIGSGTPNYWGVHDLHGVVWEWVADFHAPRLSQ
jgi:formylglycine-generating enzyme